MKMWINSEKKVLAIHEMATAAYERGDTERGDALSRLGNKAEIQQAAQKMGCLNLLNSGLRMAAEARGRWCEEASKLERGEFMFTPHDILEIQSIMKQHLRDHYDLGPRFTAEEAGLTNRLEGWTLIGYKNNPYGQGLEAYLNPLTGDLHIHGWAWCEDEYLPYDSLCHRIPSDAWYITPEGDLIQEGAGWNTEVLLGTLYREE